MKQQDMQEIIEWFNGNLHRVPESEHDYWHELLAIGLEHESTNEGEMNAFAAVFNNRLVSGVPLAEMKLFD